MTLIVGLHCDDHLLLSADSGVYESDDGSVTEAPKLECSGPFAWGFSGYEPLGNRFLAWMRTEHERLASLENERDLVNKVQAATNRINTKRWEERQADGLTRDDLKYNDFAHVIVAGYTASGPGLIFSLEHGQSHHRIGMTPGQLVMLGAEDVAQKAHEALLHDGRWTADQDGLQRLMDLAITFGFDEWDLRQPVRMLRITQRGAEDVSQERFWKRFPGLRPPWRQGE